MTLNKCLFCLSIIISFLFSCKIDRCKDITCLNNSVCEDGNCKCLPGYEGNLCDTEIRSRFIANYTMTSYCSSDTISHSLTIDAAPDDVLKVLIRHLYQSSSVVTGEVNDNGDIHIPSQPLDADKTISGTITRSGNGTFTISSSSGSLDTCTFVLNF